MKKLLSMSGGGTKIAGIIGAVRRILRDNNFSTIVGVSAGAIMTPLVAAEQLGFNGIETAKSFVLKDLKPESFLSYNPKGRFFPLSFKALRQLLTGAQGLATMQPLADRLSLTLTPIWDSLQVGPDMYAAAVDIHTGERVIQHLNPMSLDQAINAIVASASIPVFTVPIGNLLDGGIRDHSAAKPLILGHDEVHSVFTRPQEGPKFLPLEKPDMVRILMRTIDIMSAEISLSDESSERSACDVLGMPYTAYYMPQIMQSVYDTDPYRLMALEASAYTMADKTIVAKNNTIKL